MHGDLQVLNPEEKLESAHKLMGLPWKRHKSGYLYLQLPGSYLFRYTLRNDNPTGDIWRAHAFVGVDRMFVNSAGEDEADWVELVIANDLLSPQLAEEAVVRHIQQQSSALEEWLRTKGQGRPREEA